MNYIIIDVPDSNDSVSRVVLDNKAYQIRFTYNDTADCWSFGLYNEQGEPIALGIKIVPRIPLNLFFGVNELPSGFFEALGNLNRIGHDDLKNGKAKFIFVPVDTSEEN
ncbi:MAG: hypothetical protein LIO87_04255 [Eubacterium sp.]|nr:hypothetical protein [Eubacterium sp.]